MATVQKSPDSSSFPEIAERIFDKGIVIDASAKSSPDGIELLSRVADDGGASNRIIQDSILNEGLLRLPDD